MFQEDLHSGGRRILPDNEEILICESAFPKSQHERSLTL